MATLYRTVTRVGCSRDYLIRQALVKPAVCRCFSTSEVFRSGHNRWSKIKHEKGAADLRKNKERSVLAQELMQASRLFGPDPQANPRLSSAIATAKKASFPKASLESAIARGQGVSLTGASLENLVIEALLPPAAAVVIDCQTDSKARTLQGLRTIIKDHGGSVTPTSYLFRRKGRIVFEQDERRLGTDQVLEEAVEAGAEDVDVDGQGNIVIFTYPTNTSAAASKLSSGTLGLKVHSSDIVWEPVVDTMVQVNSAQTVEEAIDFVEALREDPAVQGVYLNASPGEDLDPRVWAELRNTLAM